MNVLLSILAAVCAFFAPSAALVPTDLSVHTPAGGAHVDAAASEARLVFAVQHVGLDAPALLTFEGDSVRWVHAVTLHAGRNVLIDDSFPRGDHSITLQNLVTAATTPIDLGACGDRTTFATMSTTFQLGRFAISTGGQTCEPAEA